jgi:mannose-6-phosphate isomerase-like protein (cupin superfamily)
MTSPFGINYDEAPEVVWSRAESGLDAVSQRMITERQSPNLALTHARVEAPVDYAVTIPQDMIYYGLEGRGTVTVAGEDFELAPGRAVLIPANVESRHVADEPNTLLVIFSPAPDENVNAHAHQA